MYVLLGQMLVVHKRTIWKPGCLGEKPTWWFLCWFCLLASQRYLTNLMYLKNKLNNLYYIALCSSFNLTFDIHLDVTYSKTVYGPLADCSAAGILTTLTDTMSLNQKLEKIVNCFQQNQENIAKQIGSNYFES